MTDFGAVGSVFGDGEGLVCDAWSVVDSIDVDGEGLGGSGGAIGDSEGDLVIFVCFAVAWSTRESLGGGVEIEPIWFFGGGVGEGIAVFIGGGESVAIRLVFGGRFDGGGGDDRRIINIFDGYLESLFGLVGAV